MKSTKKILSGLLALTMVSGFAACSSDSGSDSGNADATTTTEATTTTAATVEVNTEGLQDGEQEMLDSAMEALQDVELENKEIKWLAHYTINPGTDGQSKSVGLEMFEQKYGGKVTDYYTTWQDRFNTLGDLILGGEGIDFFPGDDTANFPAGVSNGMFQPVDDYIDMNSSTWQYVKEGMEIFNFGGKHFSFVTGISTEYVCWYNTQTIEENGFDDPWELYEKGEWNWDTFRKMLQDFVDEENGMLGLDNWFFEKALYTSAGAVAVDNVDGHIKSMLNDATLEKAMNFGYDLYQNGLLKDMNQYGWSVNMDLMGSGRELFDITGVWGHTGDPKTWESQIPPENLGVVPVPSPAGSENYCGVTINGYALCKGAQNPEGVALFAECQIIGSTDEGTIAISDRKSMDDNQWSQEIVDRVKICNENARLHPVYDFAPGCGNDVAGYTVNDGNSGLRAPFHGSEWSTQRESLADAIELMVNEIDAELQTKAAEWN